MAALGMFPLGSVLLPGIGLPLHVFEERYRALVEMALAGDAEFGVVLIERGSEVGGGDQRSEVGTVARILEAVPFDDGRWALATGGVRRIRVERWLDDDPFPVAEVADWPDPPVTDVDVAAQRVEANLGTLRRLLAMRAELGDGASPATVELAEDPSWATYQTAALSGIGPADAQKVLCVDDLPGRQDIVAELLGEQLEMAEARLAME